MSLAFDSQDHRHLAPDAFAESRRAVLADKTYFASHPTARSRLRPVQEGEFGEIQPEPPDLPDGLQARFYVLSEPRSIGPSGWPNRLSRRLLLVLEPDGVANAQTTTALHSRTHEAPPPLKRKRHGPGRPRGVPNGIERSTDKIKRPLKSAIADLTSLLNDYGFNVRLSADALELTVDPASPFASSAWAKSAADRLAREYRQCPALRVRIARWATGAARTGG